MEGGAHNGTLSYSAMCSVPIVCYDAPAAFWDVIITKLNGWWPSHDLAMDGVQTK
jgi:hypothetical protein